MKLYKVHDTPSTLFLVMELLTGGELFDRIVAKGHYSEADARKVTVTMLKSIHYLHELGIAHRDLKPENILLKDKTDGAEIKITDFGLSKIFQDSIGEVSASRRVHVSPRLPAASTCRRGAYAVRAARRHHLSSAPAPHPALLRGRSS